MSNIHLFSFREHAKYFYDNFQSKKGVISSSGDWKLDPIELESKFSSKTKLIIINTPNNPLGKVCLVLFIVTYLYMMTMIMTVIVAMHAFVSEHFVVGLPDHVWARLLNKNYCVSCVINMSWLRLSPPASNVHSYILQGHEDKVKWHQKYRNEIPWQRGCWWIL